MEPLVVQHPVTSQALKLYPYKTSRMGSRKGLIFQILFHSLRCSGRSALTTTCSGSVDLLEQQATHFIILSSMYRCSLFVQFLLRLGLASVEWPSRSYRIRLKIFFIGEEVYTFVIHWVILPETWRSVNPLDQALFESLALVLALRTIIRAIILIPTTLFVPGCCCGERS